jgi:hypothetical protein
VKGPLFTLNLVDTFRYKFKVFVIIL